MKVSEKVNAPKNLNAPKGLSAKKLKTLLKVKDDPNKYGLENCCPKTYWAVIEKDGTLVRGRSVFRTKRLGRGQYEVFFTGDVRDGAFIATIGRPGWSTEPSGQIGVALRYPGSPQCMPFEDNNGVWIDTHDSNGRYSDRAFHLVVMVH